MTRESGGMLVETVISVAFLVGMMASALNPTILGSLDSIKMNDYAVLERLGANGANIARATDDLSMPPNLSAATEPDEAFQSTKRVLDLGNYSIPTQLVCMVLLHVHTGADCNQALSSEVVNGTLKCNPSILENLPYSIPANGYQKSIDLFGTGEGDCSRYYTFVDWIGTTNNDFMLEANVSNLTGKPKKTPGFAAP